MAPIVSIVGKSDSGKTTLIEKLVPVLTGRGYRVGTVKHDAHQFDIDHPGKDSFRHKAAGAHTVAISSPAKVAVVREVARELVLDEIAKAYFEDVDIILTEGFKREDKPKVELLADGETELISPVGQVFLAAAAGPVSVGVPTVDRNDIEAVADEIERRFLRESRPRVLVEVNVDGRNVPLNPIMQAMVVNTTIGLLSSLKGVDNPTDISVKIRKP